MRKHSLLISSPFQDPVVAQLDETEENIVRGACAELDGFRVQRVLLMPPTKVIEGLQHLLNEDYQNKCMMQRLREEWESRHPFTDEDRNDDSEVF